MRSSFPHPPARQRRGTDPAAREEDNVAWPGVALPCAGRGDSPALTWDWTRSGGPAGPAAASALLFPRAGAGPSPSGSHTPGCSPDAPRDTPGLPPRCWQGRDQRSLCHAPARAAPEMNQAPWGQSTSQAITPQALETGEAPSKAPEFNPLIFLSQTPRRAVPPQGPALTGRSPRLRESPSALRGRRPPARCPMD